MKLLFSSELFGKLIGFYRYFFLPFACLSRKNLATWNFVSRVSYYMPKPRVTTCFSTRIHTLFYVFTCNYITSYYTLCIKFYTKCDNHELWLSTRGYALFDKKCCVSNFSPKFLQNNIITRSYMLLRVKIKIMTA